MTGSRKSLIGCGDKGKPRSTSPQTQIKKERVSEEKKYLPQDFVMEEIVTKFAIRSLLCSGAVSKHWYKTIHIDKRLTDAHFLQSQKNPKFMFSLLNAKDGVSHPLESRFFGFPTGGGDVLPFQRLPGSVVLETHGELVGLCNGFPCVSNLTRDGTSYTILQPYRGDYFHIIHPSISQELICLEYTICHGFGFDSIAKEYKLVCVFRTSHKQLNIHVFTLGTKSWRDVTTTSTLAYRISWMRASTRSDRSAIFCSTGGECLVWKIITTIGGGGANGNQNNDRSNEMEMLLSFNLHDEKFQFIQLPSKRTADEQQKHSLVAYPHLLEFKGFPCIAYSEKITWNGLSDCCNQRRHDRQGGSSSCCCCCKVHLYLLKDKVKQAWVKDESFDVRVNPPCKLLSESPSDPCCFCVGSTDTPPTRIFSFSDQIFLYWFDGKCLQVYNLRSKKSKVVIPQHAGVRDFFEAKMKEPSAIFDDGDGNIYCSNMDYQLHCQAENFLSLQSFVPEGVAGVDVADLELFAQPEDPPYTACVYVHRGPGVYYPFL